MGLFDGIKNNVRNMGGGLFVDAAEGVGKLAKKGAQAATAKVKEEVAKKKAEDEEDAAEDGNDGDDSPASDTTAKFCSNCGTKLAGAKFCPSCGTKV